MSFTKWKIGCPDSGHSKSALILLDDEQDRVISLAKESDGQIMFREECDGYFCVKMPKDEARQALLEALAWIDEV